MKHIVTLATTIAALCSSGIAIWALWAGDYFQSPVRFTVYVVLPSLVMAASVMCLLIGFRARALFATYSAAFLMGLLAVELYLQRQGLPAPVILGAAGEDASKAIESRHTDGLRAFPHICAALAPATLIGSRVVSPIVIGDTPIQILTGLADNRLPSRSSSSNRPSRTDGFGFNNPPDQWQVGAARILVAGDSFAFGVGAPLGSGFVDKLRELLGKTVNLGCSGNGPLTELATLVEYGRILKPKVVIWAYFEGNDLPKDLEREVSTPLLPRYLDPTFTQNLYGLRADLDNAILAYLRGRQTRERPAEARATAPSAIRLMRLLQFQFLRTSLGLVYGYKRHALALFERVLERARDEVRGWGGVFVFVYIPGEARYGSAIARWDADGYKRGVIDLATRLQLQIIDLDAELQIRVESPRSLYSGHFTGEGHRLVGTILADKIQPLLR